jgi:hypothetical protein
MVGEDLQSENVTRGGVAGDRVWAARNLEAREQQGARRLPGLLGIMLERASRQTNRAGPSGPAF